MVKAMVPGTVYAYPYPYPKGTTPELNTDGQIIVGYTSSLSYFAKAFLHMVLVVLLLLKI